MSTREKNALQVQGIHDKGFGIIPKAVMHDRDLPLEARALYGYFAAYAGGGSGAFPSRSKILHDLGLSKSGYYPLYNALIDEGYLRVEKSRQVANGNIYILIENPKKLVAVELPSAEALMTSSLRAGGFGTIPKALMCDTRLHIKAKGIYGYLCSYTGAGVVAFPERKHLLYHLGISEKTYYKYYNQLVQYGYITVTQRRGRSGRFQVNDYVLSARTRDMCPAEPCSKKQDNGEFQGETAPDSPEDAPKNRNSDRETEPFSHELRDLSPCTGTEPPALAPSGKKQDNRRQDIFLDAPCSHPRYGSLRYGSLQDTIKKNRVIKNREISNRVIILTAKSNRDLEKPEAKGQTDSAPAWNASRRVYMAGCSTVPGPVRRLQGQRCPSIGDGKEAPELGGS